METTNFKQVSREFQKWKHDALGKCDLSRKGNVDEAIHLLVCWINEQEGFFTTSSCSGRIVICSDDDYFDKDSRKEKKSCTWYHVSHTKVNCETAFNATMNVEGPTKLKFEGFVLHVQCATLHHAKIIHQAAVESGFRNSGITIGKKNKKIIAAVRGTACLEVPLTNKMGILLVTKEYINHLITIANKKLDDNFERIEQFENLLNKLSSVDKNGTSQSEHSANIIKPVYRKKGKVKRSSEISNSNEEDILSNGGLNILSFVSSH